jgi:putative sigma-54 modulation protein
MLVEITGRHVAVTDTIKEYARRKIQKVAEEFQGVESIHVILDVQKFRHLAEVVVQGRHHLRLEASEASEDMYASIDLVSDKIAKQLRKNREKVVTHHQTGPKLAELEVKQTQQEQE